ncbi:MAG TPA: bifunctional nuclease family protein [Terriglobia bacterium]|nr:bifunctional nuclease family protein [Terriglobia bacterium]
MKRFAILCLLASLAMGAPLLAVQQPEKEVEVRVDDMQSTPYGVSITLRATQTDDQLHMMIGVSEGQAIARALSHRTTLRPMTHDLIATILQRIGWRVQKVLIRGVSESTFLADLVLEKEGETKVIDARPSDAMAIAVRSGAKIFVNPQVFEAERERMEQEPRPRPAPSEREGIHL